MNDYNYIPNFINNILTPDILYFNRVKDYMYTDDWRWDYSKLNDLKKYKLVIADFSREHYGQDTIKYAYDILTNNGINFILLSFDSKDHLTKPNLLFYPHWYYRTKENITHQYSNDQLATIVDNNINTIEKKYLVSCLNGNSRNHRIYNYVKLREKSYIDQCLITMFNTDCFRSDEILLSDEILKFWNIEKLKLSCDYSNVSWYNINQEAYTNSYVNLVTETVTSTKVYLSEKTWKTIASGQLALIIGCTDSIAELRNFGVDVFDDIIDHSAYDQIDNPIERIDYAHTVLDKLLKDIHNLNQLTQARRKQNIDNFFLENLKVKDYKTYLLDSIKQLS